MCHRSGITSYFSVSFISTVCVQFTFVDEQPDFLGMLAEHNTRRNEPEDGFAIWITPSILPH